MFLLFKEVSGNTCIHCTKGVVQEVNIGIMIDDSCQVYSRLLPPTQGHTPLSHQSQITIHKQSYVLMRVGEGGMEKEDKYTPGVNSMLILTPFQLELDMHTLPTLSSAQASTTALYRSDW